MEHTKAGRDPTSLMKITPSDAKGDPPAYGIHTQDDTHLSTSTSAAVDPLIELELNATNFVYVNGNSGTWKGAITIDPSLDILEAYLLPLEDINVDAAGERMNLYIHTGDDLDLDLWIVGHEDSDVAPNPMKRTRMHVGSQNGSVTVKVNAINNIHPFSLEVVSQDKPITVFIPRSFHGTVTYSIWGGSAISDEVLRSCKLLNGVDENCTYFVGDFSPVVSGSGTGLVEWAPDELRAKTGNDVTIKYVDEVEPAVSKQDEAKSVVPKQDEVQSVVSKWRFLVGQLFHTHS